MAINRGQLRTLIHQRCDIENSSFETDTETDYHINFAVAATHDYLIATFGSKYNTKGGNLATVAGTATYDLPDDFYRPVSIGLGVEDFYVPLNSFDDADVLLTTLSESWGIGNMPEYTITTGDENNWGIYFNPPPDAIHDILLRYHPIPPEYTLDADAVDFPLTIIDLIIVEASLRIKDKEEREVSRLMQERAKIEDRIKDWASPVDRINPHGTIDVSNRTGSFDWRHKRMF